MASEFAISATYGGPREQKDMGEKYDDLQELGSKLVLEHPINSITVSHGWVIDGIKVEYNTTNGSVPKTHGSMGNGRKDVEITLKPTENVIEVSGVQGDALHNPEWGRQVTRLSFKIFDSKTGLIRTVDELGTGQELAQETRRDILVRGTLAGLAGTAKNGGPFVGLNQVQFYTLTPA
ncbi:hypothetical protein RhiJN_20122 [Ceratobasidium sp. AG-Ba]|nr:hypothetical protein RhiJN_20122 [Ceratobasidium sp. AG-Ba]